jgi:Ca2+-binding EF-hand superfamily protein
MPCMCFPKYVPETQANKDLLSNHYAPPVVLTSSEASSSNAAGSMTTTMAAEKKKKNKKNKKKSGAGEEEEGIHITEEHQECAVCYDDLCSHRTAVFVKSDGKTRTCKHYFHAACARELLEHANQEMMINQQGEFEEELDEEGAEMRNISEGSRGNTADNNNNNNNNENGRNDNERNRISATCPICRVPVYGSVNVPSCSTNPNLWFDIVDIDADGKVSPTDLVTILRAQFLVDWRTIEKKLTGEIWPKYDVNNEGFISRDELLKPDGLLDYLLKTFETPKRRFRNCPNLEMQPRKWFEYWDEDHSGTLDSEELIRALVKTFNVNAEVRSLRAMAESVRSVWGAFDQEDKGEISLDEFIAPEGLAQSIVATMRWSDSVPNSREHSRVSGQDGSDLRTNSSDPKPSAKPKRVGILGFSRLRVSADEKDIPDSPRDQRLAFLNNFRMTPRGSFEDIELVSTKEEDKASEQKNETT